MRTPAHEAPAPTTLARGYPGSPDQVRAVRADLRPLLNGCPIADETILAASELAANAALHSDSRNPGAFFTLRAEIHHGDYIWIEVEDRGGTWQDRTADPDRSHGLDIIQALASDWGIDGDHTSRVVWLRIDWPAP